MLKKILSLYNYVVSCGFSLLISKTNAEKFLPLGIYIKKLQSFLQASKIVENVYNKVEITLLDDGCH